MGFLNLFINQIERTAEVKFKKNPVLSHLFHQKVYQIFPICCQY